MNQTDSFEENEAQLIQAASKGSLDAFNALLLHYQSRAFNLAYHLLQDPAAADDATQEAFISAYKGLGQYRGGSFRAWLLRIVANACYDELRRRKRRPAISWDDFGDMDEEANPHLVDEGERPEEAAQRAELRRLLECTIARLPEDQRVALVLVDRLGLAYDEAAHTLDVPIGTIKSRLARARAQMRTLLLAEPELLPLRYRLEGNSSVEARR